MLSVAMPAACPDGFIAIQARSASYGSLMDAQDSPQHAGKHGGANCNNNTATDTNSSNKGSLGEPAADFTDAVPPLRTNSSTKSILKTAPSGELDSQGSGKIKRAVSWHDFEGKNLHTVREYTPSEHDDAELLFNPGEAKQCCVIC